MNPGAHDGKLNQRSLPFTYHSFVLILHCPKNFLRVDIRLDIDNPVVRGAKKDDVNARVEVYLRLGDTSRTGASLRHDMRFFSYHNLVTVSSSGLNELLTAPGKRTDVSGAGPEYFAIAR
ncbi:MAG: hypothetical protein ACKOCD_03115 [Nitrospiraceae bacterium]